MPVTLASAFGDWHGNTDFAIPAIVAATNANPDAHLIHVGDFGLYPTDFGPTYLSTVSDLLDRPIHVIPGNHEHWPSIQLGSELGFNDFDDNGFFYTPRYPNIRVSPRAHTWKWGGKLFAALTGANSIDFQFRKLGVSWWMEESPTFNHVDELVNLVDNRPVDVLITHDAPHEAIHAGNLYPPGRNTGRSDAAMQYANESARVVGQARNRLLPKVQVCGHHHTRRSVFIDGTIVEFLADDSGSLFANRLDIEVADV